jgi:hypothetical protein
VTSNISSNGCRSDAREASFSGIDVRPQEPGDACFWEWFAEPVFSPNRQCQRRSTSAAIESVRTPVVLRPYLRARAQPKNQEPSFKDPETPAAVGQHRPYSQSPIAVIRSGDARAKTRWSRTVLGVVSSPPVSRSGVVEGTAGRCSARGQAPGSPRALPPLSARNGQHGHDLDRIARENGKMRMLIE